MVIGLVGFRDRGQWTPGMEVRKEDRCQIGKSWIIAKEDHVASESFAADADKWNYLVDARALDGIEAKVAHLDASISASEAATEAAGQATRESRSQTAAQAEAMAVFESVYHQIDLDDWLYAICDAKGYLLWGIRRDGSVYQEKGMPEETRAWLERLHTLEDYDDGSFLYTIADSAGNIVWGIRKSGEVYEPKGIPTEVQSAILALNKRLDGMTSFQIIESDDYAYVLADAEDNVMFGIDHKGHVMVNGMKGVVVVEQFKSTDYLFACTDSANNLLFGIRKDGTFCVSKFELPKDLAEQIAELTGQKWMSEDTEEQEFIYKIVDAGGHIVFGVFYSGSIYMPKGMPEEVKRQFEKDAERMSLLESDVAYLKEHGKDWSGETELWLPKPRVCARVEISGEVPTSKYFPKSGTLTFTDFDGNSFTKRIEWNVQGNISAGFDKKNWSIDLLNDDGSEFSVQFGDWVPQDSFHLKAHYSDFWKTRALLVYRHAEQISRYRPYYNRRPWDRIFGAAMQSAADVLKGGIGDVAEDMRDGAMGRPDGFPFMLYVNGLPYGIYTWNLKKHKDNYHVVKNDNDGKQLFFGDYMTGVFQRVNYDYWSIRNWNLTAEQAASYPAWQEGVAYAKGTDVVDTETFDLEVNGKVSSVTIRRLFRLTGPSNDATFAGYEYDEDGYVCRTNYYVDEDSGETLTRRGGRISPYYNTMRPSYICWRHVEVRNPKKTVTRYFTGNDGNGNPTYRYEYYNYDSPADYAASGVYEYTHEIIGGDMITQKELTKLTATGEEDTFSKKEYTRSVNARATLDEYSRIIPVLQTTLTAQNLFEWGYLAKEYTGLENDATAGDYADVWAGLTSTVQGSIMTACKKQIFSEHHDVDHAIDFFLVYNDTDYYDSITHNTLYVMYDGKKIVPTLYDTDIALGMSSTYTNSFPAVPSTVLNAGNGTFVGWLYTYYKTEIQRRWKEYRDAGVISVESFAGLVHELTQSIGVENYEKELQYWTQPGYRKPVYWRMPAGGLKALTDKDGAFERWGYDESVNGYATIPAALKALYDADPSSVEYDAAKQYLTTGDADKVYCVVTDGDTVHWYQCTAACKGVSPATAYTCGSPVSGGVIDSPKRTIKWFEQRLAYLDTLWSYEPAEDAGADSGIPSSVIDDIINGN